MTSARCISDLSAWLSASRLRLNPAKTVVIWLGAKQYVLRVTVSSIQVMSTVITVVDSVRDLRVILDSHLTMSARISSMNCSAFYQLRQLRPVVHSLTTDAAKMVIQAFVSLHPDYCNSLFYGISDGLVRRLLAVQNAAARLVTGPRRRDHISPVLWQLHWLPVHQLIKFKMAVNSSQLPTFVSFDRRTLLRLFSTYIYIRLGDRAFPVAGPRL